MLVEDVWLIDGEDYTVYIYILYIFTFTYCVLRLYIYTAYVFSVDVLTWTLKNDGLNISVVFFSNFTKCVESTEDIQNHCLQLTKSLKPTANHNHRDSAIPVTVSTQSKGSDGTFQAATAIFTSPLRYIQVT